MARAKDRARCLEAGRRRRLRLLEFVWMDNTVGHPRMGLIVPKFQSTAVARNRLRRRVSEIWRREIQSRQGARDLIVRARKEAYGASFAELRLESLTLAKALGGEGRVATDDRRP